MEQVVQRVGGEAELGEHRQHRLVLRRPLQQLERGLEVMARIAEAHDGRGHRYPGEAVPVQVEELGHAPF